MDEIKNLHKGHRQRLKNKVRTSGLNILPTHEALELLLTYTIPQKDTNELAHHLLDTFGSFANILDTPYEDLVEVNGIGEETALFLSTLPKYFEMYKASKVDDTLPKLDNTGKCVEYFNSNFNINAKENLYIFCLNKACKLIKTISISGKNDCEIDLSAQSIIKQISNVNSSAVVMVHTHPHGDITPSEEDIRTTQNLIYICSLLDIKFYDHIIINETSYYSFGCEDLINKMYNQALSTLPNRNSKSLDLRQNPEFKYIQK